MSYRSPNLSLERELETLEAELAALRALPPAAPRPAPVPSKKARGDTARETARARARLKDLARKVDAREAELGVRELTPREIEAGLRMKRFGIAFVAAGALVLCAHLLVAATTQLFWTETLCTLAPDGDGDFVASYTVNQATHTFYAGGNDRPQSMPCWVPGPSVIENVGTFAKPPRPTVALRHKLSFGWISTAVIGLVFGLTAIVLNAMDERRRRSREIEPDAFDSSD